MAKHTSGPWELSPLHLSGMYLSDGGAAVLADGLRVALVDIQSKPKRGEGGKAKCPIRDANARLIVAAPDLLAACQRLVKNAECTCAEGGPGFTCDVCEGRAAIRKATGE